MKNKVALITGGSKGIGLGIAEELIKEGVKVVITGRNEADVHAATKYLNGISAESTLGLVSDVRNYEDQIITVQQAVAKFGHLDILIANAGVGHFGNITDLSPDQWKETIDINLTGVFNSVKASLEQIKKNKGYIITISSLAGTNFFAGGAAYNASKFGLVGFSQAIMMDLRSQGVKVTTIMPGSVTSYFNNHEPNESDAWKIQPQDIGQMVCDLLKMPTRTLPSKIEVRPSFPK
jgi:3-oxoacyl-[acyl-carrier protein] reductase